MDSRSNTIRAFSVQHKNVVDVIKKNGTCFSNSEFIKKKYGESASIFLTSYNWLSNKVVKYFPKPEGAELHYWAFVNDSDFETFSNSNVLVLDVPINEGIFFNVYNWNKILKLQYIGKDEKDELSFHSYIKECGIRHDSDVMLSNFYPDLKIKTLNSWQGLFKYHEQIIKGETPITSIQIAV